MLAEGDHSLYGRGTSIDLRHTAGRAREDEGHGTFSPMIKIKYTGTAK